MEANQKIVKIFSCIFLIVVLMFGVGGIIGIIATNIQTSEPSQNNQTEAKVNTLEEDIQEIKNVLNSSNVEMTGLSESEYSVYAKCEPVDTAIDKMLKSFFKNEKINEKWRTYCLSNYYESKGTYSSSKKYNLSFECDITEIKTADEMAELIKDCSQIIWESLNIIYDNSNINNDENKYFGQLHYTFNFKYSYLDSYGNTQNSLHKLYFDITRNSYNKVNKETFPNILVVDYTKIFGIGKATYELGKDGIDINFENLLVK